METSRIRNVAVIGPHGVGKTTLVESMLYDMAMLPARGRVEEGSTATDFDAEAIQRELSVGTGIAHGEWKGTAVTLLDTPGHGEFLSDTKSALAAADAAILVVDAAKGIDANVRKIFRMARDQHVPVMIFLNGVERDDARDYAELLSAMREQLDAHAVPLELPIGKGKDFKGDVDLIGMHTWYFAPGTGEVTDVPETPSEMAAEVQRYHTELVEAIAEQHDDILTRYLDGQEPDADELKSTLKRDMLADAVLPVLCGSAAENLGVRPLLDVIVELFPSPLERTYSDMVDSLTGETVPLQMVSDGPAVATVFKTFSDPYLGKISVVRVLSGMLRDDASVTDVQRNATERIGRLYKLVGKKTTPVEQLMPGEIGGIAKLKDVQTGDTLITGHHARLMRYPMPAPIPAIWSVAIEPVSKSDETKLAVSLNKLKEDDPTLTVSTEPRTHRTVLAGQGPLHLDVTLARLENRYNVKVSRSEPQIPYRETITGTAQGQGRHKKQTGGRGQFGDVWLRIEPLPRGSGFEFADEVVGGAVPRNYIPAVEKGVREMLEQGLLAGFPIVDMRVTLYDGSYHQVDSSEMAFKTAAHLALKSLFPQAKPILLEPIMDVTVTVPEEALGDTMADLNTRRGHIEGVEGNAIHAKLPLAELAGLVAEIQSYTKGQGSIESSFRGYQEVPAHLQAKLLNELKAQAA